jgi:Flp pilus assembly protein TadG
MCTTRSVRRKSRRQARRSGNILVLSAVLMVMTMAIMAFAMDVGALLVARTELQRAADAAALSATWELIDQGALSGNASTANTSSAARASAVNFASWNKVLTQPLAIATSDVEVGYVSDPTNPDSGFYTMSTAAPNAVRVRVRKSSMLNNPVSFGFARVIGINSQDLEAVATAALIASFDGFRTPGDGGNVGILPIALDEPSWDAMLAGDGTDDWRWDPVTSTASCGSDGIREVNLYPKGNGSPGNRGTVDIGSNNNSTADLARQILHGVTADDLAHHGGELRFNSSGTLALNGDTGISAGIKDELTSIIGQPRTIPVFRSVVGPGNNATYTIVRFVGIRILDVKLTGSQSSKRVIVQPATVVARGAIPSTATSGRSDFVYSPAWLID